MQTPAETVVELETKFWQSMLDQDVDTAVAMLAEPALMVSPHGSIKFDHAGYRQMADKGPMVLKSFEFSDIDVTFPTEALAVVTYRVKQGVALRGQEKGKGQVEEMNDSSTWVRSGGQWLCVMHTETPAAKAGAH